jgi:hypothetical protein
MHQAEFVNEELKAHLAQQTHKASWRSIALRSGLEPSTFTRQLDGEVKVQTVVSICRAYSLPLLPAFVAAGFITLPESEEMAGYSALLALSDRSLVEEMLRRVIEAEESGESRPELTEPVRLDDEDEFATADREFDEALAREYDTAPIATDSNGVRIDVGGLSEDQLKKDFDLAANNDRSAEKLDPDL